MPKKTDPAILLRIYKLDRLGQGRSQIIEQLAIEFGEDLVPDESTITRRLARFRLKPPAELAEDETFAWSTMTEPWEQSRIILDAWDFYQASHFPETLGPFTRRLAKWVWRVAHAMKAPGGNPALSDDGEMPDVLIPDARDHVWVALEYAWREVAAAVLGVPFDTGDLDNWLAMRPWAREYRLRAFHARRDGTGAGLVEFHHDDLEWLGHATIPFSEEYRLRARGGQLFKFSELEPLDMALRAEFLRRTDGLLPSQRVYFHERWEQWRLSLQHLRSSMILVKVGAPEESLWYVGYIDRLVSELLGPARRYEKRLRRRPPVTITLA